MREDYPRKWGVLLESFSMFMMLFVFWFTSRAFVPVSHNIESYFSYLFWGEFILFLPLSLLQQNIRTGKKMAIRGTFDLFLVTEMNPLKYFFTFSLGYFAKDIFKLIILLIMAVLFFELDLSTVNIFTLLIYIFISSLFFSLIGISIGLSLVFWGRGEGVWGQLLSFLSIMAGAYFPLSTFSDQVVTIGKILNPLQTYLEYGRLITSDGITFFPVTLCLWFVVITMGHITLYSIGLKSYRKYGPPAGISI
jgi:hypothetical protein